jgi:two-component system, OmpR family, sensor kinase
MKRLITMLLLAVAVVLGFLVSWMAQQGYLPNPTYSATYLMDFAGVFSRATVLFGVGALIIYLISWENQRIIKRKQAEELMEQRQARQRFLQRLDHELKNPLTIIRLGLVNLQQSPGLDIEQSGSLERISQQVQRLQKLITDLRLLSELDQGSIEHKPVNLRELLDETINLSCQSAEPSRKIILNVQQTPWPVTDVWGDRDLLVLVFRNLLDNALKFTTPEDQVEVRVTEDGHMAIVDVIDTGLGIQPEEIPQIFEELYRGQNARGIPGSGLGLKLVERIAELHNGSVQVRSKPEVGTVFTIKLPLAAQST